MTALFQPGPQSGDRRPAPGRLALVQAFLNSHFSLAGERGTDQFAEPARLRRWIERRGLAPGRLTAADAVRAVQMREALRAIAAEHVGTVARDPAAAERLAWSARGAVVSYTIGSDGRTAPEPAGTGLDSLFGLVLAVVHEAQTEGRWYRVKACPGPHCGWVFYDHSRNCSSSWCSMQVCGGRDKARAYRRRSRDH